MIAISLLGWFLPADAQQGSGNSGATAAADENLTFDVVAISGLIDEIVADFIEDSVITAAGRGSGGVVLQVNSRGHVVSDERLREVARTIIDSGVPVYAWVGPSGASALGGAAQLVGVAQELSVAVGARLGETGELIFPELLSDQFRNAAEFLEEGTVDEESVIEQGLATRDSPTLVFFVLDLPGFGSTVETVDGTSVRVPVSSVRFFKLPLIDGWLHGLASPAMAYLLFLIGAALLIFELYTAGVGIAGVIGAGCFILGCYGFDALPARNWAIALLVVAMLGYAIDVQVGVPRLWSWIATVCLIIGSLFLYNGMAISWITLLVGIVGVALSMISGMPSMIRTRFGTPTIGREWMVGKLAVASEDMSKEGVVNVDGAPWRARVNRTTPISAGERVRIVAIEGLYLEIEPETGGARDYREMRR
ncbi:MAG: hypothetical protein OXB92_05580 [Acidimicrobiaceae bacterium]|nr:hypothetical protein [Acidimicrobiia bacterium]MCY4493308.1 hypothetical protein [Acidimicrobiaceae bacterium]